MKALTCVSALCLASGLTGCSTIQSWFPDKEKDYQFTTELAPLVIPPDLMHQAKLPDHRVAVAPVTNAAVAAPIDKMAKAPANATKVTVDSRQPINTDTIPLNRDEIRVSVSDDPTATFTLNVPFARAWRIVGKAVTRSGIEVIERNEEAKMLTIQVTQTPAAPVDTSFLEETLSLFNVFKANETTYIIAFSPGNDQTTVALLSPHQQPLTQNHDVFMRLYAAIQSDLRK